VTAVAHLSRHRSMSDSCAASNPSQGLDASPSAVGSLQATHKHESPDFASCSSRDPHDDPHVGSSTWGSSGAVPDVPPADDWL